MQKKNDETLFHCDYSIHVLVESMVSTERKKKILFQTNKTKKTKSDTLQ